MAKANGESLKRSLSTRKTPPGMSDPVIQWGVAIGLLIALTFLLIPRGTLPSKQLDAGDIVPRDIKAANDILVEDVESTAKIKEKAAETVREVFDLDPKLSEAISKRVLTEFEKVRKGYETHAAEAASRRPAKRKGQSGADARFEGTQAFKTLEAGFFAALRIQSAPNLLRVLRERRYDPALARDVVVLLRKAMAPGVAGNRKILDSQSGKGISIQVVGGKGLREEVKDLQRFQDLESAAKGLPALAEESGVGKNARERRALAVLAASLLEPNLTVNKQATESLRTKAREAAKPVFFNIKKGEMIAREGERISPQQVIKLQGLTARREKRGFAGNVLGIAMLIAVALALAAIYLHRFKAKLMRSPQKVVLMVVILLGTIIIIQVFMQVGLMFSEAMGYGDAISYYYAIPFATGAMLGAILLDLEVALLFSALTAFLAGLVLPQTFGLPLTALVGGVVASFRVNHYRRRSSILLTALFVGLANAAVIVPLHLIEGRLFSAEGGFAVLMGIAGGAVTGIVVSAILPLLESMFNIASDIKLLELGDLDHPLMRQLVMRAPGTYHHSIMVSSLAEEAAEKIGANPLLVRVGAYYHDIGKIRKREYFIENQTGPENKHDPLAPRMSALILISHVKDGVLLGRKHKLPEQIIDFIPEHHGTSLISYFYNKAKEREDASQQAVNEADFRYPGPKPQSREAGILLLADAVEAASRSLQEPTPARIQNMVRSNVTRIFAEAQLDDCELTLRGLNLISNAFVRILTGIFHHRIGYPQAESQGQLEMEAFFDADIAEEQPADGGDRPRVDRAASPEVAEASGLSN